MRTTVTIEDALMEEALRLVPKTTKKKSPHSYILNEGLKALISQHATLRLANMSGTMPDFEIPLRNR